MRDPNLIPILLPSPGTGCEETLLNPPRIDHDPHGALVIVDAELDVFLMTEAEYSEKLRSAMIPKLAL
jgi:hypothetical protein